jgi:MoxR-like ATPase
METTLRAVAENVGRVIKGKDEVIELAVVALLCRGHLLLEDVPGVGKTTLGKALARTMQVDFQRIQFTPDLLPSDVTGASIYNQATRTFEVHKGPIFANVVLADEINRATPRTQSSLLEAMNEEQVTIDKETHPLPRPFFVIATQNPTEFHGTFPLPEAQLDRFFMRVELGYPAAPAEADILRSQQSHHPLDRLEPVVTGADILAMQEQVNAVHIAGELLEYIVAIAEHSRRLEHVRLGVSPRGSLALMRAAKGKAFVEGRNFVVPDDIQVMARPVLAHRILLDHRYSGRQSPVELVTKLLEDLPVPL